MQAKLNGLKPRLRVEASYIGHRYVELVAATRRIAGPMITQAWNIPWVFLIHRIASAFARWRSRKGAKDDGLANPFANLRGRVVPAGS